jgi:hypothetical protein
MNNDLMHKEVIIVEFEPHSKNLTGGLRKITKSSISTEKNSEHCRWIQLAGWQDMGEESGCIAGEIVACSKVLLNICLEKLNETWQLSLGRQNPPRLRELYYYIHTLYIEYITLSIF